MKTSLFVVLCAASLAACGGGSSTPPPSGAATGEQSTGALTGAGATFPFPIYSKWFDEYHRAHPEVQINYQSLGSGAGIRQLLAGTVDFGASDSPMTDEQLSQAKVNILHLPTVLGAVVPIYNLPGAPSDLKFTPAALAGIFLGTIKKWNDPAIAKANAGAALPNADIIVVHRSDGSGTTFIWTDFLSKISPDWQSKVGKNSAVNWPVGLGGKGTEGVTGLVAQTPNSIGYVELTYALQNKLSFGSVQNASGAFVKADLASVTDAARGAAANMPADFRVSITNPSGAAAYPISSYTWLLVPERIADGRKGQILVGFLKWMISDGQKMVEALSYASLPEAVVAMEQKAIDRIQAGQ